MPPLPSGTTTIDGWQDDEGRRYRVIGGQDHRVDGVEGRIGTTAVQWDDGSIDVTQNDGPTVWLGIGSPEGIRPATARQLAYALLAAADEADGWVA